MQGILRVASLHGIDRYPDVRREYARWMSERALDVRFNLRETARRRETIFDDVADAHEFGELEFRSGPEQE